MDTLSNKLVKELTHSGCEIFIVGGLVRDELLGISEESKDLDLLITNIDIEDLCNILKRHGNLDIVGKSFGVIKFKPFTSNEVIDISVPRIDNKIGVGHKEFQVTIGKDITLEHDMARRDFTINALAKNFVTGDIIDITGQGIEDLNNKLLRMVSSDSMKEDPLRMLRCIQFSSRFQFKIEENTMTNIIDNRKLIHTVSKDRFVEEFKKLFEKSSRPSIGLFQFSKTGLMAELIPDLDFQFVNFKAIDKLPKDSFATFMLLLLVSANSVQFLQDFRFPNEFVTLVQEAMEFLRKGELTDREVVILNNDKKSSDELITIIDNVFTVFGLSFRFSKTLHTLRSKKIPTCIKELPINGNDLIQQGFKGPEIGKKLRELLLSGVI